jgi:hypothetical protein
MRHHDVHEIRFWQETQDLAARHQPDVVHPDRCGFPGCVDPGPYPCFARRLADHCALFLRRRWVGRASVPHR